MKQLVESIKFFLINDEVFYSSVFFEKDLIYLLDADKLFHRLSDALWEM